MSMDQITVSIQANFERHLYDEAPPSKAKSTQGCNMGHKLQPQHPSCCKRCPSSCHDSSDVLESKDFIPDQLAGNVIPDSSCTQSQSAPCKSSLVKHAYRKEQQQLLSGESVGVMGAAALYKFVYLCGCAGMPSLSTCRCVHAPHCGSGLRSSKANSGKWSCAASALLLG